MFNRYSRSEFQQSDAGITGMRLVCLAVYTCPGDWAEIENEKTMIMPE